MLIAERLPNTVNKQDVVLYYIRQDRKGLDLFSGSGVASKGIIKEMNAQDVRKEILTQYMLIAEMLGVKEGNLFSVEAANGFAITFAQTYKNLHIHEFYIAFQLAFEGKLNVDLEHYQSFSITYINKVMRAYNDYRNTAVIKVEKALKIATGYSDLMQLGIESIKANNEALKLTFITYLKKVKGLELNRAEQISLQFEPVEDLMYIAQSYHGFKIRKDDYLERLETQKEVIINAIKLKSQNLGISLALEKINDKQSIESRANAELARVYLTEFTQTFINNNLSYPITELAELFYSTTHLGKKIAITVIDKNHFHRIVNSPEYAAYRIMYRD